MMMLQPGLFSIIFCATTRPTKSDVPPGANGLMMVIGLVGKACAPAAPAAAANASAATIFETGFIVFPSLVRRMNCG
jgi:hypothetical protein